MDIILNFSDRYVLDDAYAALLPRREALDPLSLSTAKASLSQWPRDNIYRQSISFFVIALIFGYLSYFATALASYYFLFDRSSMVNNPRFQRNQIRREISESVWSIFCLAVFHVPVFVLQARGYSKLYNNASERPVGLGPWYEWAVIPLFIGVSETVYYFLHRLLHSKLLYGIAHKQHHKWVFATPFAGYAFHPLDGALQSMPYVFFIFTFPLRKSYYFGFFTFINIWTTLLHDGEFVADSPIVLGPGNHTIHHGRLDKNYGHLFSAWDRIMGTYRDPMADKAMIEKRRPAKKRD